MRGRGFVQTHMPEHPVMEAIISGDREAFLEREIAQRQAGMLPPYGRLAALIVSARDKELAERVRPRCRPPRAAGGTHRGARSGRGADRRRSRPPSLAAAGRRRRARSTCRAICAPGWRTMPELKGDLRLTVDIDPYSFL